MKAVFNSSYIGSKEDEARTGCVLLGCPLDVTSTFRGGTKFAPESIRKASWTLETYSPYLKQDLDDVMFRDAGCLPSHPPTAAKRIRRVSAGRLIPKSITAVFPPNILA